MLVAARQNYFTALAMKMFAPLISIIFLAVVALVPANAFAKARKGSASPRPSAAIDTNDRITALSLTSVIVTVSATHQSKEYKVVPATKISVNGKSSTLSGLAVGMDVAVTTLPNDPTTAAAIDAKTANH